MTLHLSGCQTPKEWLELVNISVHESGARLYAAWCPAMDTTEETEALQTEQKKKNTVHHTVYEVEKWLFSKREFIKFMLSWNLLSFKFESPLLSIQRLSIQCWKDSGATGNPSHLLTSPCYYTDTEKHDWIKLWWRQNTRIFPTVQWGHGFGSKSAGTSVDNGAQSLKTWWKDIFTSPLSCLLYKPQSKTKKALMVFDSLLDPE